MEGEFSIFDSILQCVNITIILNNVATKCLYGGIKVVDLISQMSESSRQVYLQKFEFNTVYGELVKHLEKHSKGFLKDVPS